jgi:hypothetical protein
MLPEYSIVTRGAEASDAARAFGRKMIAVLAESHHKNNKVYRLLADGTELIATRAHEQYRLTITTPVRVATQSAVYSALWIPRGFVLYPASSTATAGWGTPVIGPDDDQTAKDNLAPGLDVARWTVGGYLGEVLLTKQVGAGYPKPDLELSPAFYSIKEAVVMISTDGTKYTPAKRAYIAPAIAQDWSAYRIEFTDFSTAGGEGDPGARRSVFHTAVDGAAYLPPIRGNYDAAARLVRNARSSDFSGLRLDDGTLSHAADGYDTAVRRLNKDGVGDTAAHDSVSLATNAIVAADDAATGAHMRDATFTPERTSVSVALKNGMTALAAVEHAQWIAYGNRYWIGDDPALPVVTWDGFPSWNWPLGLILGTQIAGSFVDLGWFTTPVRGSNKALFSKRVCANGREIGALPDWVLSAGVQTKTVGAVTTDRLVVLAWRLSDQGTYDPAFTPPPYGNGGEYNRVLRVYFIDVPRRDGLALLPDAAAIGVYDATTNPNGWHYAGQVELWQLTGTSPPSDGFYLAFTGLSQPPQFKGDGTAAIFARAMFTRADSSHLQTTPFEILLAGMGDGLLSYTIGLVDLGRIPPPPIFLSNPLYGAWLGVDYKPGSSDLDVVFAITGGVERSDGLFYADTVIRWHNDGLSTQFNMHPGNVWFATNYLTSDLFGGYSVHVMDPRTGTFVVVQQLQGGPGDPYTFRLYYCKGGAAPVVTTYDDVTMQSNGTLFAGVYGGNPIHVLPSFARNRDGNYVAGYELAPSGTFEGSHFDSDAGDIATLTQTPGGDLRLFPIGVV